MAADTISATHPGEVQPKAGLAQAIILTLATFLPVMAIVSLAPDIPQMIQRFHAVPNVGVLIPIVLTTPGLCIALLSPVAGLAVDFIGRRRILLAACVLYTIAGLAPLFLEDLRQIIASRVALGVAEAILMTAGNALIGDYFQGAERRRWLAIQAGFGAVLGSLMWLAGGFLANMGWHWPFAIYAVAIPVFVAASIWIFEPRKPGAALADGGAPAEAKTRFPLVWMAMVCAVTLITTTIYFVYTLNAGLVFGMIGLTSPKMVGIVTAIVSIGVPLGAVVYGRLSGIRTNYLLALTYFLLGVGLVGFGLSHDYLIGGGLAFFQQIGAGMTVPMLVAWAQSRLPFEHRGRGMGVWVTCFFVGQFTCPFAIAEISRFTANLQQTVVVIGVISLVMAVLSLLSAFRGRAVTAESTLQNAA